MDRFAFSCKYHSTERGACQVSGKLFNPKDIPDRFRDCFIEVEVQCGTPWERVVKTVVATSKACQKTQAAHEARGGTGEPVGTVGKSGSGRIDGYTKTLGWQPGCDCGGMASGVHVPLSPVPCVCLDPFMGSGTVAEVAAKLGRNWLGIELNPKYIQLAKERLGLLALIKD